MNFIRLAGIIPLGIGLTVLGFLWSSSLDEFGRSPFLLFFRIFGSFIALGFVLTGFGILFASPATLMEQMKARQKELQDSSLTSLEKRVPSPAPGKLKCPNADYSPPLQKDTPPVRTCD
jgi:hypothetical protein